MSTYNSNYDLLPEHIRDSFKLYLEEGKEPGGFVSKVLENDLIRSFAAADDICIAGMFNIANFVYNEMPLASWGSAENMKEWMLFKREEIRAGIEVRGIQK